MKKAVSILLSVVLIGIIYVPVNAEESGLSISAASAVIYDCDLEQFLFSKDSKTQRSIASTTKIMTAIVVLENTDDLSQEVTVDESAVGAEGTSMYLKTGDVLSVMDLLYGMMLTSGNDAAAALAMFTAGSISGFVKLMNSKAKDLSLSGTHFENPSGLPAQNHYSTAYDMAILAAYALRNKTFVEICSAVSYDVCFINNGTKQTLYNHNKLLSTYDGCIGVKTGFTQSAGRCLVSAIKRNGHTIIAVTLNDPDDWDDHEQMFDFALSSYKSFSVLTGEQSVPVVGGTSQRLSVTCTAKYSVPSQLADSVDIEFNLPQFVYAPVKSGDVIGTAVLSLDGKVFKTVQLTAQDSVKAKQKKLSLFERIKNFFGRIF